MFLKDVSTNSTRRKTPEGYMHVNATITRAGVLEYDPFHIVSGGGTVPPEHAKKATVRILRPSEEVFNPKSMQTFANIPVTDKHPKEFLDSENVRRHQIGFSKSTVERDGDFLKTELVIQDAAMIAKIEKHGVEQVSIGADLEIEWKSGVDAKHGHYDGYIRDIRGNHIAIVPRGRAGAGVKLSDEKGEKMATRKINGLTVELTDQAAEAFDAQSAKLEDAKATFEAEKVELTTKLNDAVTEIEKLKGELDAEKATRLSDEDVDAKVAERTALIDEARKLHKDVEVDGKSLSEIKRAAIVHVNDSLSLEDKSDDYVNGIFETLQKTHKPQESKKISAALKDGLKPERDSAKALEERNLRNREAWKVGA
jgi:hypothetical protein